MAYIESKEKGAFEDAQPGGKIDPKRIDQLEKRIVVLERIATDKTKNLKDEIERL